VNRRPLHWGSRLTDEDGVVEGFRATNTKPSN
jgi:hypothetical protein